MDLNNNNNNDLNNNESINNQIENLIQNEFNSNNYDANYSLNLNQLTQFINLNNQEDCLINATSENVDNICQNDLEQNLNNEDMEVYTNQNFGKFLKFCYFKNLIII
jgi:hypothetical protein